ncbi:MAG: hypothetical protein DRP30_03635 [Thermotoga sp.]|nr:MAG: hypothetical protein DRP30_03635 [Thermotoga sp.]
MSMEHRRFKRKIFIGISIIYSCFLAISFILTLTLLKSEVNIFYILLSLSITGIAGIFVLYKFMSSICNSILDPMFHFIEHILKSFGEVELESLLPNGISSEMERILEAYDDLITKTQDMRKGLTETVKKLSNMNERLRILNRIMVNANALMSKIITDGMKHEDVLRMFFSKILELKTDITCVIFEGGFKKIEMGDCSHDLREYSTDYGKLKLGFIEDEDEMSKVFEQVLVHEIMNFIRDVHIIKKISDLARYDELTGLYNRNHFNELLSLEMKKALRYGREISLVLLDLDNFKELNDNHGHQFGDEVLKIFADKLRRNFREIDILGRYGGDEFTIAIVESGYDDSRKRVEEFRKKLNPIDVNGFKVNLNFSFGIAQFPTDGKNLDELIRIADERLYMDKRKKSKRE